MNKRDNIKIDLVYMWVNGNDPQWLEEKNKWSKKLNLKITNDNSDSRFTDNEELRFSLRSVEKNAPWINKIYIVTNGQVPTWLNTSNPKVKIIKHSEIMPKEALPTFSSCAIESCIANIPELSEHFLLANDDCFFYRPVKPSFFFTKDGKPIVRLIKRKPDFQKLRSSLYQRTLYYSKKIFEKKYKKRFNYIPHHCIDAYSKKAYLECIEEFKDEFNIAIFNRFRGNNVQRVIISFYMLAKKLCKLDLIKPNMGWIHMNSLCLNLDNYNLIRHIIRKHTPYLLCLNDEPWVQPMIRNNFKNFLTELYPKASSYEIKKDFKIPVNNTSKEAVVFSVSNKYADIFSVALQSILENIDKNKSLDIIIFDHKIVTSKKLLLEKMVNKFPNVYARFVNIDNYLVETLEVLKIKSKSLYKDNIIDKLLIPFILSDYEKVLYLDSDTCVNTNILDIFKLDFKNKPLIAVRDTVTPVLKNTPDTHEYLVKNLKLANIENYFNTGVLLFNLKNLDLVQYKKNLINATQFGSFSFPAQDILNIIFNKDVTLVHPKWNYINSIFAHSRSYLNFVTKEEKEEYIEALNDIKIIHYTSIVKPWLVKFLDNSEIFWKYAKNSLFYETILCSYNNPKKLLEYSGLKPDIFKKYYLTNFLSFILFEKNQKVLKRKRLYRKMFLKLKYIKENL